MESTKGSFGWWGNLVVKCALTGVVIWALMASLQLMKLWYTAHPPTRRNDDRSPGFAGATNPERTAQKIQVFWPQFLGSEHSLIHQVTVNGVQITSQAWDTTVAGKDVIDYYREQMTARGWQDVTADTLQFRPDFQSGSSGNGAEAERYIRMYRKAMDSDLILNHGSWSMQVSALPDDENNGYTTVSVCAASTPSLQDFFLRLSASFGKDTLQGGQPVDMVQQTGNGTYHMTIAPRDVSPAQAFQEALSDARAKGWSSVVLPNQTRASGSFTWMTKGADYAALSVAPAQQGVGSIVTFIQVTAQ
jgi:hypothetical protein